MYQITCDDKILHDLRVEDRKVINPKLSLELNKSGSLTFIMPPTNPTKINLLKSVIRVFKNGSKIFEGRALNNESDFYNKGKVVCEGELAYLIDSIIRPYELHNMSVRDYLQFLINNHNSQVEIQKQFKLGNVTVSDNNNSLYRLNENYPKTLDEINDKLIDRLGGYLKVRYEDNNRYLDYISTLDKLNSQVIRFGKNLLDITQYLNGADIKTAIIPLGKDKITISDVNNNLDYIYNQTAVNLYGWIWDTVSFDDVTVSSNLLTKANNYLNNIINTALTITLSAIDLSYIDIKIEEIKLGDLIRVVSKPHKLDHNFLINKLTLDLENPANDKIELGDIIIGLTEKSIKESKILINSININKDSLKNELKQDINIVDNKVNLTQNEIKTTKDDINKQQKYIIMGV
ncbi:MAG: hypothetical protein GX275_06055 [Clostridiales bacterium]|nr:hypothetical protein [Clostridiales bacterium]